MPCQSYLRICHLAPSLAWKEGFTATSACLPSLSPVENARCFPLIRGRWAARSLRNRFPRSAAPRSRESSRRSARSLQVLSWREPAPVSIQTTAGCSSIANTSCASRTVCGPRVPRLQPGGCSWEWPPSSTHSNSAVRDQYDKLFEWRMIGDPIGSHSGSEIQLPLTVLCGNLRHGAWANTPNSFGITFLSGVRRSRVPSPCGDAAYG